MKISQNIAKLAKKVGMASAKASVCSASVFYGYQAKEPDNAKEICSRKKK